MSTAFNHQPNTGTESNECFTIVAARCLKANVKAAGISNKLL